MHRELRACRRLAVALESRFVNYRVVSARRVGRAACLEADGHDDVRLSFLRLVRLDAGVDERY